MTERIDVFPINIPRGTPYMGPLKPGMTLNARNHFIGPAVQRFWHLRPMEGRSDGDGRSCGRRLRTRRGHRSIDIAASSLDLRYVSHDGRCEHGASHVCVPGPGVVAVPDVLGYAVKPVCETT